MSDNATPPEGQPTRLVKEPRGPSIAAIFVLALVLGAPALALGVTVDRMYAAHAFNRAAATALYATVTASASHGAAAEQRAASLAATLRPCVLAYRTNDVDAELSACLGEELDKTRAANPASAADLAAFAASIGYPAPQYTRIIQVH